jgi:hypothetical protein
MIAAAMAFSALTMAAIMAGRVRFGIEHAVTSRYATFSVPFAIAVYVLLIARERAAPTRTNRAILVGIVGLILAGTGVAFCRGPSHREGHPRVQGISTDRAWLD